MADTKISALPDAGALDGTESVPIVQGSSTVKVLLSAISAWIVTQLAARLLPAGGSTSDALRKTSGSDYAVGWATVSEVPTSGTTGHVLTKTSGSYAFQAAPATPPAGSDGQLQYKAISPAGGFAAAAYTSIEGGVLKLTLPPSTPSTPSSGVLLFARSLAGRVLPAWVGPDGTDTAAQSSLARNKVGTWASVGNTSSALSTTGLQTPAITGTSTARNVGTSNFYDGLRRTAFLTTASAGNSAGIRNGVRQWWRGNAAKAGGFFFVCRFGFSDAAPISDARAFIGFVAVTGALANADPSSNTSILGVGHDSADTELQFYHNDASGTATKSACGAAFPVGTSATDAYEIIIFCQPNGSNVSYRLTNLTTGDVATYTATSDLPTNTTLLAIQLWRNNGATAAAAALDVMSAYIETDY